jgi:uncharacterized protein YabN with tetrapyrrole methylase and pyrophosphatase domain
MESKPGESQVRDYFAESLLVKLDAVDPIFAAYEAQDVSRNVGFDFADFQDVVPRALDEIRETKEALAEEGEEGRDHYGDEVADIMFSLVNLARHAGIGDLPTIADLGDNVPSDHTLDPMAVIEGIGQRISEVAEAQQVQPAEFEAAMTELFKTGMVDAIRLALAHNFDAESLLRENVRKYLVRCHAIEQLAAEDDKSWADLYANNEIITYWKRAKVLLS